MQRGRRLIAGIAGLSRSRWGCHAVCLGWVLIAGLGCSEQLAPNAGSYKTSDMASATAPMPPAAAPGEAAPAPGVPVPPALPRKIIYNAQVELVVESVSGTADALLGLVKQNGAYIADSDIQSYSHLRQQATWKVRVPVERFDAFLAAITRLGELQKTHLDSQDVTQEYYDLEARISNKQEEEKRLLKHLADSTGKLEDILAVERELSRVRGEVEQMQGRLRFLANVSALSTVTIVATEVKDYVPPVSPTFGTQIDRTFRQSVALLADFGKAAVLLFVAAVPWLPVATVLALPFWWLGRRHLSHRASRARTGAD